MKKLSAATELSQALRRYLGTSELPGVEFHPHRGDNVNLWKAIEESQSESGSQIHVTCARKTFDSWQVTICLSDLRRLAKVICDSSG